MKLPTSREGWAAALTVVALAGLVVDNVAVAVWNQERLAAGDRLHVSPRDVEKLASASRNPEVEGRLANLYYLGQRIAGATVTLPPPMAGFAWMFRRVARVEVVVSPTPLVVDPERHTRLVRMTHVKRRWYLRMNPKGRGYQELLIRFDDDTRDYVLAETARGQALFLIPAPLFERFKAPPGILPPSARPAEPQAAIEDEAT